MIVKNADVYTEGKGFVPRDILMEGDSFVSCMQQVSDRTEIDVNGCYAIPGLTDIHFHGCAGYDFCDGTRAAIDAMAAYEASVGVTNIVPATMTLSEERLLKICGTARMWKESGNPGGQARLWGINLEGPFLSPDKKGAQNAAYLCNPDIDMFDRLNRASGGMIRLVSIAPEREGAMEFIERKRGKVILALAHTAADYDTAVRAFEKGADHVGHLYNAMAPYGHREPGLAGAAADREDVQVELICDGVHVHPAVVRAAFKLFGDDRIILISDSMMATGLADGGYSLGEQPVRVKGSLATLRDGAIAGSVTNLADCLRTAVREMGIPLESAIKCAAVNPAKRLRIYGRHGSIATGKAADVVLLDKKDLALRRVILGGQLIV